MFAISHHSLGQLVDQVDFSKLKDFTEADRLLFYEALADSIPPGSRESPSMCLLPAVSLTGAADLA